MGLPEGIPFDSPSPSPEARPTRYWTRGGRLLGLYAALKAVKGAFVLG